MSTAAIVPGLSWASQDFINSALRLVGALASGETPSQAESADALATLNQMIDGWQTQGWMVFAITRLVYAPVTLKQTYTVGPGGDVNILRPAKLPRVSVINQASFPQPIELPLDMIDDQDWQQIPVKNTSGSFPLVCYDDCAFPSRNLNFWPIAQQSIQFALYLWTLLSQFPDLITQFQFPPMYMKAIRYNLAVELMAEFPGDPALYPMVQKIAEESIGDIKAMNYRPLIMQCDPGVVNPKLDLYNWLTDEPAGR